MDKRPFLPAALPAANAGSSRSPRFAWVRLGSHFVRCSSPVRKTLADLRCFSASVSRGHYSALALNRATDISRHFATFGDKPTTGPTTGLRDYGTTGLQDYGTTGLRDYGTTGLRDYRTTGLRDYGTTGPRDYGTTGLRGYGTTGLRDYGTTGLRDYAPRPFFALHPLPDHFHVLIPKAGQEDTTPTTKEVGWLSSGCQQGVFSFSLL
jgi:hypothetical protein